MNNFDEEKSKGKINENINNPEYIIGVEKNNIVNCNDFKFDKEKKIEEFIWNRNLEKFYKIKFEEFEIQYKKIKL